MKPVKDDQPNEQLYPVYPGGENSKAYAFAFQVWMALFLICICFGLLNFIASCWPAGLWPKSTG